MEQLELLPLASTPAPVLVAFFDKQHRDDYLRMAANLRTAGIGTEVYPDAKKLGAQLKYADQKGFTVAVIAGGNEWSEGRVQVKNLATKQAIDVDYRHESPAELFQAVDRIIDEQS